jgi:hypothetical protein
MYIVDICLLLMEREGIEFPRSFKKRLLYRLQIHNYIYKYNYRIGVNFFCSLEPCSILNEP